MLGGDGLALGGGDLVVDGGTGDLGDGVAVLDLDWDQLDLGVVNTVLSGDLTASVLDGGLGRVGNGLGGSLGDVGDWGDSSVDSGGVTDVVSEKLADLLVFDLLGLDSLGGAHVLGVGDTGLGGEDLDDSLAVGG